MFNDKQIEAINSLDGRIRVIAGAGSGKCLAKDTAVLMYDGTIKMVQDIQIGDQLMGPDSKPRNVLSTCTGTEQMYEIQPTRGGESWGCNASHILSLKCGWTKITRGYLVCRKNDVINMSVSKYLQRGKASRKVFRLYRAAVDFARKQTLPIDAYIYGLWLGDGHTNYPTLTNKDKKVVDFWCSYASSLGLNVTTKKQQGKCPMYSYSKAGTKQKRNIFYELIKKSTCQGHKRIIQSYKTASREDRWKLLAGIIDTDGYKTPNNNTWEITSKYKDLAEDYAFVARSLGCRVSVRKKEKCKFNGRCYEAYTVRIGGDLRECPIKLDRKKAAREFRDGDPLKTSFKVIDKGIGQYYGFTIDGDHLFMLGDFTVTHNTMCLVERYIKLLDFVNPENILCITFTNKAANEMKKRISQKHDLYNPYIMTFHGFCLRVLKQSIGRLGTYPNNFSIIDTEDQKSILKKVYKECDIDYELIKYTTAIDLITNRKVTTEECLDNLVKKDNIISELYEKSKQQLKIYKTDRQIIKDCIYYGYLLHQQKNNSLDFNDLIILCVMLFKQNEDILSIWQNKFKYVMVDEFQDVSSRQCELVNMLSAKSGNLFVVGDPDQTIYSWRGAKPEILVNFKADKTIIMNQNYRSTPNILNLANELISNNEMRVAKDLFTQNKEGSKVCYTCYKNTEQEAKGVIDLIHKALEKYEPRDIAILYRMHFLSRPIEEQLVRHKIPYVIYSGVNFYERKEIKDILAYLRLINNVNDDIAFERIINVPRRGIGKKKLETLKEYSKNCSLYQGMMDLIRNGEGKAFEDFSHLISMLVYKSKNEDLQTLVQDVINLSGYKDLMNSEFEQERKENIQELIKSIGNEPLTLDEYLQEISLLTNTDINEKSKRNCVSLMTIHAAKGLEFPIVFVIGMNDNYFPSPKCTSKEELEEERRLAYVAYTRAKNVLLLSECNDITYDKQQKETSRFITEVSKEHYNLCGKPTRPFKEKEHENILL